MRLKSYNMRFDSYNVIYSPMVAFLHFLLLRTFSLSENGPSMVFPYAYCVERGREGWREVVVCCV
jgi:hypothetical protein